MSEGFIPNPDVLHREILASHECCRQYGIDPLGTRNLSQVQLNPEELNVRREQNKDFLEVEP